MADARALLDDAVIGSRYFFPRPDAPRDPVMVEVDGAQLACSADTPHKGGPTLLHFHGNGEVVGDWQRDFAKAVTDRGINVVLGEYRGYGGSTGTPALASMLDDALVIADQLGGDPERLYVYGRSVGSIYALHVAANRPVAGLILESGIADVEERLLLRLDPAELGTDDAGLSSAIAELLDHESKIAGFAGDVLVLHAAGDDLVPPDHAERMHGWARPGAKLELFARGDHNSIHAYNGAAIVDMIAAMCGG